MAIGPSRRLTTFVIVALGLAACGDEQPSATAGAGTTMPAAPASTFPATTRATAAPPDEECANDLRTLEVAVEAYSAQYGTFPEDEATLVTARLIRRESETYDVVPGSGEVVRVADVACDEATVTGSSDETGLDPAPMTADEFYAELEASGSIESIGGPECARELSEIAAAAMEFEAREGRGPDTLDEISDALAIDVVLWTFDAERAGLVPAPGSPCVDLAAASERGAQDACAAHRRTLEVAREAYFAQLGAEAAEPTETDLVTQGLLRQQSDLVDLVDGTVVPQPGGGCD